MGLRTMGHCTMDVAEDGVAYGEVSDRGHCGCTLPTIGVTNHGTEDNDIVDNGLLDKQSDKITLKFSTLKTTNQFK